MAACLLSAVSLALPKSKVIESSIILFDTVFTCLLLLLCRASNRIFDDLFGKPSLLDLIVKRLASGSRVQAAREGDRVLPADQLVPEQDPAGDREMERRPN